jgi:hypothetical protein
MKQTAKFFHRKINISFCDYLIIPKKEINTFIVGCNLYCLDKNYGGFLIIWDRIFGTFAEEHKGEEIIYGLVYNQPSFNPVFLQVSVKHSLFTYFLQAVAISNRKHWSYSCQYILTHFSGIL